MDLKTLQLESYEYSDVPTRTQLANMLGDMHRFLSKIGGTLLATETNTITDQPVAVLLNATVQLKQASDLFNQSPSNSGLVHAVPAPGMRPH